MPVTSKFDKEKNINAIKNWKEAGLLLPSAIKPVISTVEQIIVIKKLGALLKEDMEIVDIVKKRSERQYIRTSLFAIIKIAPLRRVNI